MEKEQNLDGKDLGLSPGFGPQPPLGSLGHTLYLLNSSAGKSNFTQFKVWQASNYPQERGKGVKHVYREMATMIDGI